MRTRLATTLFALGLVTFLVGLTACSPPHNRGASGYRVDPTRDAESELGVIEPRSADLVTATDNMARDLASRRDIVDPDSPPIIVVGKIENHSSYPERDFQVFLQRLRAELQASGARHGLRFVRERAYIEEQRAREYGGKDPESTSEEYMSAADYILTCEVRDLPAGGTNYYLFDYQLVQLRDAATGPRVGSGAIVWENMYEVKFQ